MNVGYGFWQMSWGSKQTLNAGSYATARAAISSMKGDFGRPLGLNPRLLIVPPSLESAARKIVSNDLGPNGESNEWKGTAEVMICPWLA
jgi:phage major head subunit gpT-like protein